ncbi:ribosomal-processing cysteine protease Prp [Clostridium tagluense]|uniref:Ribosomal processing cysteine protease Prp n=1 Tax=Clostridium tagluense TaxID=360422 RepID=A0A401UHV5_9CLOT|nr:MULTISPECIES: ribosomal-processing cysteine protease Prp [Clostridium]MBU3128409.1 ribosomal-processing cysteine protease Prp [Clostridium tagluense]MBZ9624697.1 ribosomal-processing cysteine protease Prp [Clostridium sp. FP2]MCB2297321.1 ribosomal-processing cysteine protease Prp [Clostridium tagluense]MCB2313183.1 ribosomal-processing cysteine protease Prp [Clostridium tagluense]MCB2317949.1 ribosomal-processing cysteine protease Prp [Clostridium tagluense]
MVKVEFVRRASKIVSFKIKGHALPKEEQLGVDLICSAISAISQTTVIGIEEVLKIKVKYYIEDGFLNVNLENQTLEDIERCQVLLETMMLGLKSIEITYGDYIKLETEEV